MMLLEVRNEVMAIQASDRPDQDNRTNRQHDDWIQALEMRQPTQAREAQGKHHRHKKAPSNPIEADPTPRMRSLLSTD